MYDPWILHRALRTLKGLLTGHRLVKRQNRVGDPRTRDGLSTDQGIAAASLAGHLLTPGRSDAESLRTLGQVS